MRIKFLLICIFLFTIVSFAAVSAADNAVAINNENLDGADEIMEVSTDSAPDELWASSGAGDDSKLGDGESDTYIINNANYNDYFNQSNSGKLIDAIPDGATLDFQGSIINTNQSEKVWLVVSKQVNIVSSTGDAYIDLNTTSGDYFGANPGSYFALNYDASGSNVSGIRFHNTQLWLSNTHNIVLDNISVVVENQRIGSGVGVTAIRDNSTYITVRNSYFYTKNNEGSTSIAFSWANYCTFENNTVKVSNDGGAVGNMIYLNTYNCNIPSGADYNHHNIIRDNVIYGPETPAAIAWGIVINGPDNMIENNSIYYNGGVGLAVAYGSVITANNTFKGNKLYNGSSIGGMGKFQDVSFVDNYVSGSVTVDSNCLVSNNNVGKITVNGANVKIDNNFVNGDVSIAKAATNTTFKDNIMQGSVTVQSGSCNIVGNVIDSTGNYAVDLKKTSNNVVKNNVLISINKIGNDAVNIGTGSNNTVENNYGNNAFVTLIAPEIVSAGELFNVNATVFDGFGNPLNGTVSINDQDLNEGEIEVINGFGSCNWGPSEPKIINFTLSILTTEISGFSSEDIVFVSAPVTVDRYDTIIGVEGDNITDGFNATIRVLLRQDNDLIFFAPVVVNVNGVNVTTVTTSGDWLDVVINASMLGLGDNNVTVYYDGDTTHKPSNATATIHAEKNKKVTADVVVEDAVYGNPAVLKITNFQDAYGKKLSAYGGYQLVGPSTPYGSFYVSKGKCTANFNNLPAGNYSVYIVFGNNVGGDYQFENYVVDFTVFEAPVNLTASLNDFAYGNGTLNVKVTDTKNKAISGKINVTIDGNEYVSDVNINGETDIALVNVDDNSQTAEITFDADHYLKTTISVDLIVIPTIYKTYLNASNLVMTYNDGSTWNVALTDEDGNAISNATVKIGVNGEIAELVSGGEGVVRFPVELIPGIYDINATFEATDMYEYSFVNATVIVNKYATNLIVTADNITVGETAVINVTIDENATGIVTVIVDADEYSVEMNNGKGQVIIEGLKVNHYGVGAYYESASAIYDSAENFTEFDVNKIKPAVDIDVLNAIAGENATVIVIIPNATGSVTLIIKGNQYDVDLFDGQANYTLLNIAPDTYDVIAIYGGDENFDGGLNSTVFAVDKLTAEIKVNVSAVEYGSDALIIVELPRDATGYITVDTMPESVWELSDGAVNITVPNVIESVNMTVEYNGSTKYNPATANVELIVSKISTILTAENLVMTYNEGSAWIASLTDAHDNAIGNATIKISVNGEILNSITDEHGVIELPFDLASNVYNVVAAYEGDYKYESSSVNVTITVMPAINNIVVIAEDTTLPDNVTVKVTADVDDTYVVTVGDKSVNVIVENGEGLSTVCLANGEYTATVAWENENYTANVADAIFNVFKAEGFINITSNDIDYGEDLVVNVALPSDATGCATVTLGSDSKYVSLTNGTGFATFDGLSAGTYEVVASYYGDDNYLAVSTSATAVVNRADASIEVTAKAYESSNNVLVEVTVPSDISRRLSVTVGDETKLVSLKNGKGSVVFKDLASGTYDVSATYNGDANYLKSTANTTVTVARDVPTISIVANSISYGDNLTVNVVLPSDATGCATVTIGKESKIVELANGTGSAIFTGLAVGTHAIAASYDGDDNYLAVSTKGSAVVNRADASIEVTAKSYESNNNVLVEVIAPCDISRRVSITIGDETKLVSLKNGKGSVVFKGLAGGTHVVTANYNGDANYMKSSANTTVLVKNVTDIIVVANSVGYGEDLVVDITLPSDVSRRAIVKVDNESKMVSLKDGAASLKYSGLAVGTHNITVSYNGDGNYLKASVDATVKVTKADVHFEIIAENITAGEALNVVVKSTSDISRRVNVVVGGVTKTVSLKNGIANVKFTDLDAGIYDVAVSYNGDSNYKATAVLTKVEVKA